MIDTDTKVSECVRNALIMERAGMPAFAQFWREKAGPLGTAVEMMGLFDGNLLNGRGRA